MMRRLMLHCIHSKNSTCWIDNDVRYMRFVMFKDQHLSTISTFLCCQNCVPVCCGDGV